MISYVYCTFTIELTCFLGFHSDQLLPNEQKFEKKKAFFLLFSSRNFLCYLHSKGLSLVIFVF